VFINLPNSIQNAGHTCRPLFYITCYFKEVTNELQLSQLELKVPCHDLFLDSIYIGLVWHFIHEFLMASHIQASYLRGGKKPCLIFE